ncbi:MAG: hypothetical protein HY896_09200 [Deltaproteobacteria bacterium]|nr:hypothetical protein [Deltaproteobacteria bacterium]
MIFAGYVAGANQAAGADNGIAGKYFLSVDPFQYIQLHPDGTCLAGARELTPSGTFKGSITVLKMTYGVKGDIITLTGGPQGNSIDFRLEGNALVPLQKQRGTPAMKKAMEGSKYIRR